MADDDYDLLVFMAVDAETRISWFSDMLRGEKPAELYWPLVWLTCEDSILHQEHAATTVREGEALSIGSMITRGYHECLNASQRELFVTRLSIGVWNRIELLTNPHLISVINETVRTLDLEMHPQRIDLGLEILRYAERLCPEVVIVTIDCRSRRLLPEAPIATPICMKDLMSYELPVKGLPSIRLAMQPLFDLARRSNVQVDDLIKLLIQLLILMYLEKQDEPWEEDFECMSEALIALHSIHREDGYHRELELIEKLTQTNY